MSKLHACERHRIIGCARCFHGLSELEYLRRTAVPGRSRAMDEDQGFGFRSAEDDADVRDLARHMRSYLRRRRKSTRDTAPNPADWGADLKRRADGSLKAAADYNGRLGRTRGRDGLPALRDLERLRDRAAQTCAFIAYH